MDVAQTGFGGLAAEVLALGELNTVGRRLHAVVTDLARILNGFDEVRRDRRLAARELYGHLAARLDRDGVVEDFLNILHAQLMYEADLIGVHEARIAHHVAAVRQVNRQHGTATILDRAGAVVVKLLVVGRLNVAAPKHRLDVREELRGNRHHVFIVAVLGAVLDHPDLAVALDDLSLDLADLLVDQEANIFLAADDI